MSAASVGRERFVADREGGSERAQTYRRLMKLVKENFPALDWLMADTAVNLYLDNPDRDVASLLADVPPGYFLKQEDEKGEGDEPEVEVVSKAHNEDEQTDSGGRGGRVSEEEADDSRE
jgi:hypothetical protein